MPQLDFCEALSTPDEKLSVHSPVAATPVLVPRPKNREPDFANAVGFSRSSWANIVFVTIACLGGLFSAFYFFNGAEALRAAAARPSEFLYPRPVGEKIDIDVQPNLSNRFSRIASTNNPSASNLRTNDSQSASPQNFLPSNLALGPAAPVVPSGPIIVPPVFPPPPPPSLLDDLNSILNGTVSGANALV